MSDKKIVKVAVQIRVTHFLEQDGSLWTCGCSIWECGLGIDFGLGALSEVRVPHRNHYFEKKAIKIQDVRCSQCGFLALDTNGRVYTHGQYIISNFEFYDERVPEPMTALDDYKVDMIRCGANHAFCRTECGKHFLFGRNHHGQCLVDASWSIQVKPHMCDVSVLTPHRIDELIERKYGHQIESVLLDNDATIILCSAKLNNKLKLQLI